jgi:Aminomethyltransferase folate-binding domain
MASNPQDAALKRTPLYDLHVSLGAKMVPFAGYQVPVQYPMGVLKEQLHTRTSVGRRQNRHDHIQRLRTIRKRSDCDGLCRDGTRDHRHESAAAGAWQTAAGTGRKNAVCATSVF